VKHIQTNVNHLKAAKYSSNNLKIHKKDYSSNLMVILDISCRGHSCRYL